MEKLIKIKDEYNSLDTLLQFLEKETSYTCSKVYDVWEMRTDANGQMEQCVLIKKSSMHAVKAYFTENGALQTSHVIPSKTMHAYFGKNQKKARRNILEVIVGNGSRALLAGSQRKSFEEIMQSFNSIKA